MGMFDWYEPQPPVKCPHCDSTLSGWQGKDGPRGLFEWVQGCAAPARQRVDDEWAATDLARAALRLPEAFEVYTECAACKTWVRALGSCEHDVWTRVALLHPLEQPGLPEGWMPLPADDAHDTRAELLREIPTGHVLAGRKLFPIARRSSDDVLIRTTGPDPTLWEVHMTWRNETDPQWPRARSFRDVAELAADQDE